MKEIKDERVEEIINMYFKLLFKIAYNYTLDAFKAEDIVQEVFLKFYRARNTFNDDVKQNLYGNISNYKKKFEINMNGPYNEIFQQHIVDLIIKYQEKMKFNLILTVFDYSQDTTSGGKFPYKDSKNAYIVNREELKKENCYFTFKLPKVHFSKKTTFLEPINLCLNYNSNLFGLITYFNANNEEKLIFHAFNKSIDDYRPTRILDKIEYDYQ